MDLHTGVPVWLQEGVGPEIPTQPLVAPQECDVAVVGAGITGALLVERLTREGLDTILVDSREYGTGSTAASTCLLLPQTDTHLSELVERFGADAARRVYRLGFEAVDEIERLIRELPNGGECGFARRPSLYFASGPEHVPSLEAEARARKALGFECEVLTQGALEARGWTLRAPLAILSDGGAEVNALRLSRMLIEWAITRGLRAFGEARMKTEEGSGSDGRVTLLSQGGVRVHANHAVFASGYEAHEALPADLGTLETTWVFASQPVRSMDGWPDHAMIWESARPYVYLRTLPEGRVLMGGGDEHDPSAHLDEAKLRVKALGLAKRFGEMFPGMELTRIDAWAGVFGASVDGLPYIGRPFAGKNQWYALGYGGNGITFSAIAARLIVDELTGKADAESLKDRQLFRFGRK